MIKVAEKSDGDSSAEVLAAAAESKWKRKESEWPTNILHGRREELNANEKIFQVKSGNVFPILRLPTMIIKYRDSATQNQILEWLPSAETVAKK